MEGCSAIGASAAATPLYSAICFCKETSRRHNDRGSTDVGVDVSADEGLAEEDAVEDDAAAIAACVACCDAGCDVDCAGACVPDPDAAPCDAAMLCGGAP